MATSDFSKGFPGILENEPLSNHCTFRVGGSARFFYVLTDIDELPKIIRAAKTAAIPYVITGWGSNMIFPDEGIDGLVIKMGAKGLKIEEEHIEAEAGVLMAQIVPFGALRTVPGTVGGAIRGNAGTMGIEIAEILEKVQVYSPSTDEVRELSRDEIEMSYRHTSFCENDDIIMRGYFDMGLLDAEKRARTDEDFKEGLAFRKEKQPVEQSAGSFFKNPEPGVRQKSAGYLIDSAGLKGRKIGGAQISEKHANFFVNDGSATCRDILELAELAKVEVKKQFGIDLEEEVQVVRI